MDVPHLWDGISLSAAGPAVETPRSSGCVGWSHTILIFTTEYITGIWLTRRNLCPWNYSHARWNVHGVIRLDYAPGWFLLGLLYENMLKKRK